MHPYRIVVQNITSTERSKPVYQAYQHMIVLIYRLEATKVKYFEGFSIKYCQRMKYNIEYDCRKEKEYFLIFLTLLVLLSLWLCPGLEEYISTYDFIVCSAYTPRPADDQYEQAWWLPKYPLTRGGSPTAGSQLSTSNAWGEKELSSGNNNIAGLLQYLFNYSVRLLLNRK